MKCITLTLNPAFDRHCAVQGFACGREHLATSDICEAGGKGVNISRALSANGVENLALVVTGKENEAAFCSALDADGLNYIKLSLNGKVRENLTVHSDNGEETRISFAGFCASDSLLCDAFELIKPQLGSDTVVTFTGRLPSGVSMDATMQFLSKIREQGAKVVIDSKSFTSLEQIIAARPWLIKPNGEEISAYLGREVKTLAEIADVAESLRREGIENVMVSLGGKGALLASREGIYTCTPPDVKVKSTIGAGDSSIGGFIAATLEGESAAEALRRSVAFGTAACLSEGTRPPMREDVERILGEVMLENIVSY